MRILIVQYAGDYREAVQQFAAGQDETYYAQQYSVDSVAAIGERVEEIALLCCKTEQPYDERLANGVRAIGAGFQQDVDFNAVIRQIAAYQPTHLILNMPVREILSWANSRKIPTLAMFADSFTPPKGFSAKAIRSQLRNSQLAKALNHPNVQWIGNHGITAASSLSVIGVSSSKMIPWDWPHTVTPADYAAKTLAVAAEPPTLVYVGAMVEAKGIGDVMEAVAHLKAQNLPVRLKMAGKGDLAQLRQKANQLQISDSVEFLGLVGNKTIIPLMRSADLVMVPSRHDYPEGFPMTIFEALCSRTPIVASDHPMFLKQLQHQENAMLFPAGNAAAIAAQIATILHDPDLYSAISEATQATWQNLQLPVKWADLVSHWAEQSLESQTWLAQYTLASGRYAQKPPHSHSSSPLKPAVALPSLPSLD